MNKRSNVIVAMLLIALVSSLAPLSKAKRQSTKKF